MAFSGRELILILRATNQASGPLRQIGRDLRMLGRGGAQSLGQLNAAQQQSVRNWQRIGTFGAVMRDTGRVARLGGIAIGAGLGFAAKGYAEFNTQTGLAATQTGNFRSAVGKTTVEVARNADIIEKGILAQMRKYPASAKEMSDATYEIFSSTHLGSQGLRGLRNGLKLLNVANKAAVAGQVDLSDVTKTVTTVMNAFKTPVSAIPKTLQRMFAAVRFGRITFAELLQALNQIIPSGSAANQTFDTLVGSFAALTRVMPNARMAATALSRLMEVIGRKAFVTGAKEWGMTMTDSLGRLRPLNEIVGEFNKLVARTPEKDRAGLVRNFFKEISALGEGTKSGFEATVQARRALTHLMRSYGLYSTVLGQVTDDNTEFTKSFQVMASRAGVQWDTFMNRMRAAWLAVGKAAIPILMQLLEPVRELAEAFSNLDREQRNNIVRWLAIGAAVLIVGGTLTKIVGSLITFAAGIKMAGGSLTVWLAGITLVASALLILVGRGDLVHSAFDNLFDTATASTRNLIIAIAALYIAMSRLSTAAALPMLLGVRRRAGTAGAAAGLIGGAGRQAAQNATRMGAAGRVAAGAWGATRASLLLLPGPLKVAAGLTAGVAAAAWLVHRHFERAAASAQRMKDIQNAFREFARAPVAAARGVSPLGMNIRDAERARIVVQDLDSRVKSLKQSIQAASAAERPELQRELRGLYIDRAEAIERMQIANVVANQSFMQGTQFIRAQAANLGRLSEQEGQLTSLQARRRGLIRELAEVQRQAIVSGGSDVSIERARIEDALDAVNNRIIGVRISMAALGQTTNRAAIVLRDNFVRAMQDLGRAKIIPQAPQQALRDMLRAFIQLRQRLPTLKEARVFIQAWLDPASLGKVDKDIAAWIRRTQGQRQLRIDLQRGREFARDTGQIPKPKDIPKVKLPPAVMGTSLLPPVNKKKVKKDVEAFFRKPIKQPISLGPVTPDAAVLGAQIAAGIASGVTAGSPAINSAVVGAVQRAVAAGQAAAKAGSPSKLTRDLVGLPLAQGVAVGIRQGIPDLVLAGTEMIELFTGKVISDLQNASISIEFFSSKFLQDLEENIQEAKDKLTDARKTNDAEARKFIGRKITPSALIRDMQIQAEQLTMFVGTISRLARRGAPRELLNQLRELGQEGAEKLRILANASDKELKRYIAAWRRAQDAVRRFSRVTAQDLIKDIKSQGAALRAMNADLTRLAAKGVPAIILAQLAKLGVEGAAQVKTLASMTKAQLRAWVAAWYAANAQLRKLMSMAQYEEILQQNQDFFDRLFDPMELVQRVKSMAEEVKAAMLQAFGTLFSDAIRQRVGQAFADAMSSWNTEMAGLQRELSDAYNELAAENARYQQELAAAQIQAVKERAAELQQQFGQLFAGDWLKDKLDWRKALKMKDLKRDLQEQINAFKDWRTSLATLATRAIPPGLLQALEELGIENRDLIRILATSTDAELQEYIDLWQQGQTAINDIARTATADTSEITARHMEAVASIMQRIQELNERMAQLQKDKPKPLTFEDIFGDLQKQRDAFNEWIGILEGLRKRGLPAALLQQLRELGPEAVEILRILVNATDEEIARYIALWQSAGVAIGDATKAWADAITPEEILSGMRKQVDDFKAWQEALSTLMGRVLSDGTKIPAALIDTLRKLGPEALPYLQALVGMTKEQLDEFVRLWKTGQAEITAASREEWIKNGKALAQGFIQGLAEASPAMARALGLTLIDIGRDGAALAHDPWFKEGQALLGKVGDGVLSMKPSFISLVQGFLNDTQPIIDSGTPFWQGIGTSMADNIGSAFEGAWSTWADRIRAIIAGVTPPTLPPNFVPPGLPPAPAAAGFGAGIAGATVGGSTTVHMQVNAQKDQSLLSTLELASFRWRNTPG
jgi:TP901 family phage tail tape measure protein